MPVPDSPVIKIVELVKAYFLALFFILTQAGDFPIVSSKEYFATNPLEDNFLRILRSNFCISEIFCNEYILPLFTSFTYIEDFFIKYCLLYIFINNSSSSFNFFSLIDEQISSTFFPKTSYFIL